MKKIWWEQVKAVIRLEMRKTFFARRGLWIYVVAIAAGSAFYGVCGGVGEPPRQDGEHGRAGRKAAYLPGYAGHQA